jgi:hypothetical protein
LSTKFQMQTITRFLALLPGLSALAGELPQPSKVFLQQHCTECHDAEVKKGGLDLSSLAFDPLSPTWVKVHDRVATGEMPPEKKPRPEAPAKAAFLTDLSTPITQAQLAQQTEHGRGVLRRLNRVEYETAVSDLLGLPLRLRELLPPDARSDGFDTVGAALNVSSVQMESYLQALDTALDQATQLIDQPPVKKYRLSYLQSHGMMQVYRKGGPHTPMPDGMAMFAPEFYSHMNSLLEHFVVLHSARYHVKVAARALRSKEPVTLTVRMGGPGHKEDDDVPRKLLGNVSVNEAPEGQGQVFEFDDYLERGQMFRIYPSSLRKMRFSGPQQEGTQKDYQGPAVVVQWVEVEGPFYDSWPPSCHEGLWAGVPSEPIPDVEPNEDRNAQLDHPPAQTAKPRMTRGLKNKETGNKNYYDPKQGVGGEPIYIQRRITEPLHPTRRLAPQSPKAEAQRLLAGFIPRAFRHPVKDEDIAPFVALVHRWLEDGVEFEQAMRAGYKAVLTSPGFLYQQGGKPMAPGKPELSQAELAERLSFFLWNSLPDATLRDKAAQTKLSDARFLSAQVERMLRDPRSERFLESFLGQWLDLRQIDFTAPDSELYPEYTELLHTSLLAETKAFMRELMEADLSVSNVIHSDFVMLNDQLARHYGIPGVTGIHLRKVSLPADSVRGGVLTQGSVLKITANGTTTSPVVRGKWVLERIMGYTPDPPPPGIPAIEPDIRGATTVRQQLEQHRSNTSCASCHMKIDPPGVALESFDVIGGWRSHYRALTSTDDMKKPAYGPTAPPPLRYTQGLPVDTKDQLADGKRFEDIRSFKQLLLQDPDQMARTLVKQLIIYGTGAPVSFADRNEVERIVASTRGKQHGFRSIIHAVVESPLFARR